MNKIKTRIKREFEENPVQTIVVFTMAVTAIAKVIDVTSAAQGRRAYSKQVNASIRRNG
jgi:hypothetical protein